jgi:hypothetical protein
VCRLSRSGWPPSGPLREARLARTQRATRAASMMGSLSLCDRTAESTASMRRWESRKSCPPLQAHLATLLGYSAPPATGRPHPYAGRRRVRPSPPPTGHSRRQPHTPPDGSPVKPYQLALVHHSRAEPFSAVQKQPRGRSPLGGRSFMGIRSRPRFRMKLFLLGREITKTEEVTT